MYDIDNGWISDATIDPCPAAERSQALKHILRLKELGIPSRCLVLPDRWKKAILCDVCPLSDVLLFAARPLKSSRHSAA